jgi:hypothetical protein
VTAAVQSFIAVAVRKWYLRHGDNSGTQNKWERPLLEIATRQRPVKTQQTKKT